MHPDISPRSLQPVHDRHTLDLNAWAHVWFDYLEDLDPNSDHYADAIRYIGHTLGRSPVARSLDFDDAGRVVSQLRFIGAPDTLPSNDSKTDEELTDAELLREAEWQIQRSQALAMGRLLVGVTLESAEAQDAYLVERSYAGLDPLTLVLNRRGKERQLEERYGISKKRPPRLPDGEKKSPTTLEEYYFDAANFKFINDFLGHHVGDAAIREIAWELQTIFRDSDAPILYRHGGDEFGVILPDMSTAETFALAKRIEEIQRRKIERYIESRTRIEAVIGNLRATGKPVRVDLAQHPLTPKEEAHGKRPHYRIFVNEDEVADLKDIVVLAVGVSRGVVNSLPTVETLRRRADAAMEANKRELHILIGGADRIG